MTIFDAHLDLAWNVTRGRDVTRPAREQPAVDGETATAGLPDLAAGGVTDCCATLFAYPETDTSGGGGGGGGYTDQAGAAGQVREQLAIYRAWRETGRIRFPTPLATPLPGESGDALSCRLLMEGADAMTLAAESDDASPAAWRRAGVELVGLAWRATRWAGGTASPGPLTPDGRKLVAELDAAGFIHDVSHLADDSAADLLDLAGGRVCASHSNCRSIVGDDPAGRQLTDAVIRRIASRGGVVGMVLYDRFLLPAAEVGRRRATLADVVRHVRHVCDVTGSARHVGLGTDLDGGFGRERLPVEIETAADLPRIGEALSAAGFADAEVAGMTGGNWRRFFGKTRDG